MTQSAGRKTKGAGERRLLSNIAAPQLLLKSFCQRLATRGGAVFLYAPDATVTDAGQATDRAIFYCLGCASANAALRRANPQHCRRETLQSLKNVGD